MWGFLQEANGPRVIYELDQPRIGTIGDDGVRTNPYLDVLFRKDVVEKSN
jgi:hypothetical protein